MKQGRGERRGKEHKFPTRTHGQARGDTQLCWTRQDQLETRTRSYQIPSISSRSACAILPRLGEGKAQQGIGHAEGPRGGGAEPFSCSSVRRSIMALETQR